MPRIDGLSTKALPFISAGVPVQGVFDRFNGLLQSKVLPDYLAANLAGYLFQGGVGAATALTTTLSTTATGLILSNAPNSGVVLIPLRCRLALATAPAGVATVGWGFSYHASTLVTHTTPAVVRKGILTDAADVTSETTGRLDTSSTLPLTPIILDAVGGGPVATGSVTSPYIDMEWKGELGLMPGCSMATFCLTTAISVIGMMRWLALPLS